MAIVSISAFAQEKTIKKGNKEYDKYAYFEAKLNKVELKKTYLYDLETKAGEEYIFLGK